MLKRTYWHIFQHTNIVSWHGPYFFQTSKDRVAHVYKPASVRMWQYRGVFDIACGWMQPIGENSRVQAGRSCKRRREVGQFLVPVVTAHVVFACLYHSWSEI